MRFLCDSRRARYASGCITRPCCGTGFGKVRMQFRICKRCKSDVPKRARFCPCCGGKQPPRSFRRIVRFCGVLLLVVAGAGTVARIHQVRRASAEDRWDLTDAEWRALEAQYPKVDVHAPWAECHNDAMKLYPNADNAMRQRIAVRWFDNRASVRQSVPERISAHPG